MKKLLNIRIAFVMQNMQKIGNSVEKFIGKGIEEFLSYSLSLVLQRILLLRSLR